MALSKKNAVDTAESIFRDQRQHEKTRLDRITRALQPETVDRPWATRPSDVVRGIVPTSDCGVHIPDDAPPVMRVLARKARSNYLDLALNDYTAALFVDGYRSATAEDNARPWDWWQANGMDARQGGLYRHALGYGVAYMLGLPGDTAPVMRAKSPRTMTALYGDPVADDWPMLALEVAGRLWYLYDEEQKYTIGRESNSNAVFIDREAHDLGVCPVVRYRDRMGLDGDPMGIIEPLIPIQARIDETTFGLLVAQHYAAFKQRYIIGWVPESEEEMLKARASSVWTFEDGTDKGVSVGALPESDLSKYIESGDSARRDLAATSQLPLHNFSIGAIANLSAEALAAMEASKDRRVGEFQTSFGESHEQLFRLAGRAAKDDAAANDTSAQVRWRDTTARSLAQTADALGKLAQMLGVPPQALWSKIPGATDQDIKEWKRLAAQQPPPEEPPAPPPAA